MSTPNPNWTQIERDLEKFRIINGPSGDNDDVGSSMAPHDRDSISRDSFLENSARAAANTYPGCDDLDFVPERGQYRNRSQSDSDYTFSDTSDADDDMNVYKLVGSPVTDDSSTDDLADVDPRFRDYKSKSFLQNYFSGSSSGSIIKDKSKQGDEQQAKPMISTMVSTAVTTTPTTQSTLSSIQQSHSVSQDYSSTMSTLKKIANDRVLRIINAHLLNMVQDLDISNIRQLEYLPEVLSTFEHLKSFRANSCDLVCLRNLPPKLEKLVVCNNVIKIINHSELPTTLLHLNMTNNNVEHVFLENSNLEELILNANPLSLTLNFPKKLRVLKVSKSDIESTNAFLDLQLTELDISESKINNIDKLPQTLKILRMNRLAVKVVTSLPPNLQEWYATGSDIEKITFPEFGASLQTISLFDAELNTVPKLPSIVNKVDLMRNRLTEYPSLPETIIESFDVRDNPIVCDNIAMAEKIEAHLKSKNPSANILIVTSVHDNANRTSTSSIPPAVLEYQRRIQQNNQQYNHQYYNSRFNNSTFGSYDPKDFSAFTDISFGKTGDGSPTSIVRIDTRDEVKEIGMQQAMRNKNLFAQNPVSGSSGRGGRGGHGNFSNYGGTFKGRGGQFNNFFANPTHDRELMRKMTDDGHRPSRKYQIQHKLVYTVK